MTRDERLALVLLANAGIVAFVVGVVHNQRPPAPPNTGIAGTVTEGPLAPGAQPGVPNVMPYVATVTAYVGNVLIVRTQSAADGTTPGSGNRSAWR